MDSLIIFGAKYLIFLIPLIWLVVWWQQQRSNRIRLIISSIIAGLIGLVGLYLASKLYFHHRPFIVNNIKPLVGHADDNGFPSEHTAAAMTLATVLYFYNRRWAALAILATLLVGLSRVLAHVHWVVDILGGLAIGLIAGALGYWLSGYVKKTKTVETEKTSN